MQPYYLHTHTQTHMHWHAQNVTVCMCVCALNSLWRRHRQQRQTTTIDTTTTTNERPQLSASVAAAASLSVVIGAVATLFINCQAHIAPSLSLACRAFSSPLAHLRAAAPVSICSPPLFFFLPLPLAHKTISIYQAGGSSFPKYLLYSYVFMFLMLLFLFLFALFALSALPSLPAATVAVDGAHVIHSKQSATERENVALFGARSLLLSVSLFSLPSPRYFAFSWVRKKSDVMFVGLMALPDVAPRCRLLPLQLFVFFCYYKSATLFLLRSLTTTITTSIRDEQKCKWNKKKGKEKRRKNSNWRSLSASDYFLLPYFLFCVFLFTIATHTCTHSCQISRFVFVFVWPEDFARIFLAWLL